MARKLLVADDSSTIQKVIKLALSSEGYEIIAAAEGKDALQIIETQRPNVVLVDKALPGMDAFELKKKVDTLSDLSGIKFVLLSSAFEKIDDNQLKKSTFDYQLTKPFDPSQLRSVIAELADKSNVQAAPSTSPPKIEKRLTEIQPDKEDHEPQVDSHHIPSGNFLTIEPGSIPVEFNDSESGDLPPTLPKDEPLVEDEVTAEISVSDLEPLENFQESLSQQLHADYIAPKDEISFPTIALEKDDQESRATPPPFNRQHPEENSQDSLSVSEPESVPTSETILLEKPVEIEPEIEKSVSENKPHEDTTDIQSLTDSTIQLSGINSENDKEPTRNEDSWILDDSKHMKTEATPPPFKPSKPALEPLPTYEEKTSAALRGLRAKFDDGGSHFLSMGLQAPPTPPKPTPVSAPDETKNFGIGIAPPPPSQPQPEIDTAEIEKMVRKDLEEKLQKLAEEMVPKIAESIIRQEIEKILSES
ncbi:MAG: response regulator [Bacteriovoracia bacterium]